MLERYTSFIEDRLLESAISESMIYYTKEFKDSLYKLSLKSPIAKALIDVEYTDVKPDMTFIGMSDKEGYFSFTQINKAARAAKKAAEEIEQKHGIEKGSVSEVIAKNILDGSISQSDVNFIYNDEPYSLKSKARSEAKIAKLVNQIFPGKYSEKEVEEFTNTFKNLKKQKNEFELVKGKDIVKWYNKANYQEEKGDLGNSCMRHAGCADYFKIYTENPEVCSMLILKDSEGEKILGRALVWKLEIGIEGVEYYMDRIYAIDDATKKMFQDYADEKGWLKRRTSNYNDYMDFMLGQETHNDYRAQVKLNKWMFDKYPYMDTFKALIVKSGTLINSEDDSYSGRYIMTHTDGGYDDTSVKWSDYFDCRIPEDDAVYSEPLGDWIYRSDAMEVRIGSSRYRGWYPDEYDSVIHDPIRDAYIHENDAVWSDYHDAYIYKGDECYAISDVSWYNSKFIDTHEVNVSEKSNNLVGTNEMMCKEYLYSVNESNDFIKDILGYNRERGKYYIESLKVELYTTERGVFSKIDTYILRLQGKKAYTTDKPDYDYGLKSETKKELLEACREKIAEFKNIIDGKQTRLDLDGDKEYIKGLKAKMNELLEREEELTRWD